MAYIALYRKYRPNTFKGIVGQENVTTILKNQVKSSKISHAYIFSGTRGTGKTSAAKVFARAINCLHPVDGEPCNECEVCKNILEGNTTDVVEMDAASNNSVENIRQIRQEVVYATVDVKYRVYIIDEAHMLTTSAFNALLKTLEEPPENVVFILATTEQHKIPVTILSRCLRFEFSRISEETIINRLKYVLEEEKINYEKEAINYIAKLADGGLRDALSILERCISEYKDILKYEDVLRIVGAINKNIVNDICDKIEALDANSVISNIDKIVEKGKDLRQLNYQITEEMLSRLISSSDNSKRYIKIIDRLSKLDNDLRLTSKPVIVMKACMVELCSIEEKKITGNVEGGLDIKPLLQKISSLENEIEKLKTKISNNVVYNNTSNIKNVENRIENSKIKNETVEQIEESADKFLDEELLKKYIVEAGNLKLYSSIAAAKIFISENILIVVTNNAFAYSILKSDESINTIIRIYNEHYEKIDNVYIRFQENNIDTTPKIEKYLKENDINYTKLD